MPVALTSSSTLDLANCPVYRLDTDTLLAIFEYLPHDSFLDVSTTCKWLREACKPDLFRNVALCVLRTNSVREALAMQTDIWKHASGLTFIGDWRELREVVPFSAIAKFVANMPNLHRILVEGTEEFEGSISWAYLRGILSSPRFRHLKISVAVDLNHAATFTTELDFSLPPLTSLTLTIPDYKYHPRHDNVKAKLLSAFLPKLSLTLECLSISLDVAPLQLIGTLQWPRLRELTLQGDRRVSLDPEFASIALSAGMPELRSFSILRAQRSKRRRHTLWPAEWTGGVPFSKLERLEVSYPIPADEIYSHLPDTLRRLSLRCWPRHYHHRYRYERDAMRRLWWKSPILTASELLTILRRCQAAPLEHLEIEYEVDDHDEALLRSLSELFPALRTLTVFRYRPKDHTGEIQVESIARALSNLLHLRVLRIHLDFPHAPHPLSPIETWSCFAELDAFQAFLSIPAETLARNLSSSLRFVCLFQRRMYENVWFPFRIIRDPSAGTRGSRSTVQKVLLDDAVLSIEGLRMKEDPSPNIEETMIPGPDFIDEFPFD